MGLWVEDGRVIVEPDDGLTEADVAALAAHKPAIVEFLTAEAAVKQPTYPYRFVWTPQAATAMLATVLDRCAHWRETAGPRVRPRIEALMKESEPVVAGLLDEGDFDSLRHCLIDLQRNIGDAISGRRWN
jgi:hypothetical protein